jgi:hypothetical protein
MARDRKPPPRPSTIGILIKQTKLDVDVEGLCADMLTVTGRTQILSVALL